MNCNKILVTNYGKGFKNKPIREIFKDHKLVFNEDTKELTINDSLFIHVFKKLPFVRKIECNNIWFQSNIYHLENIN